LRSASKSKQYTRYINSFGRATDPFPSLLAKGHVNAFTLWFGDDYKNGIIRHLTPLECERLMGLPENWTAYGHDDKKISDGIRYKALGNSIALPCAEYIMTGIKGVLEK
jgi:DNA (cytosine-5)-methyltransferase 1